MTRRDHLDRQSHAAVLLPDGGCDRALLLPRSRDLASCTDAPAERGLHVNSPSHFEGARRGVAGADAPASAGPRSSRSDASGALQANPVPSCSSLAPAPHRHAARARRANQSGLTRRRHRRRARGLPGRRASSAATGTRASRCTARSCRRGTTSSFRRAAGCGRSRTRAWLRALVTRADRPFEAPMPAHWQVTDAPPDYIDTMLRAIVGIEDR